jgi:hypothetical protein
MENKHDWAAGFNMGYEAANKTRNVQNRPELHKLLRIIYRQTGREIK